MTVTRIFILTTTLFAVSSPSMPVFAQTDGDIATARALATEGIRLERQGDYQAALDRLRRAEKLYDAPTHLLHIARCEAALGRVLNAAEAYQRVLHKKLGDDAPEAFIRAQQEARNELPDVESRVPAVVLHVSPKNLQGLTFRIDGKSVPDAVVDVPRFVNPGKHTIEASAPGFLPRDKTIDVAEARRVDVSLELVRAPQETENLKDDVVKRPAQPERDVYPSEKNPSLYGGKTFFVQGRLMFRKPIGNMVDLQVDGHTWTPGSVNDYFAYELGAEAIVGLRVKGPIGLMVFAGATEVYPGTSRTLGQQMSDTMDEGQMRVLSGTRLYGGAGVAYQHRADVGGTFAAISFGLGTISNTSRGNSANGTQTVDIDWNTIMGRMSFGYLFPLGGGSSIGPYGMVEYVGETSATFSCRYCEKTNATARLNGTAGYQALTIGFQGQWGMDFGESD